MGNSGAESSTATGAWRPTASRLAALLLTTSLWSCQFHPGTLDNSCEIFDKLPLTAVTSEPEATVLEEMGTIRVIHGSGRVHMNKGDFVKVEQSTAMPGYADQATVFLNGWELSYSGGDEHVFGLTALITKISVERGSRITWQAIGALADSDGKEAYDWRYHYTVVAWNGVNLGAMVDQSDNEKFCNSDPHTVSGEDNFFIASNLGMDTALAAFPSFLENPGFRAGRTVAVLPRGFGFYWDNGHGHKLLQLAYDLSSSEAFIQHQSYRKASGTIAHPLSLPPTARVGGGFVSWNSHAIMKDDDRHRGYSFGELVSGMGGVEVGVVQPAFSILPVSPNSTGGTQSSGGVRTEDVTIDNVPYAYAVPMLTGWNLRYQLEDENVKQIGIWLHDIRYERPPAAPTGRLYYKVSSVLRDDDNWPDFYADHKVTILGLRPTAGGRIP